MLLHSVGRILKNDFVLQIMKLYSAGTSFSEAEFVQYLRPVGGGPSGNTCPRWLSHLAHLISVRTMPSDRSCCSRMASSEAGAQKLGQPDPLSYFVLLENKASPQQTQWYIPGVFVSQYFPVKAGSVPPQRHTSYCSSLSSLRQSASDFCGSPVISSLYSRSRQHSAPSGHSTWIGIPAPV